MKNSTVTTAMLVTAISTLGVRMLPEKMGGKGAMPEVKNLLGVGVVFLVLTTLDDAAPQLARPLAVAVAGTSFALYGTPVLTNLFGEAGEKNA